MGDSGLQPLAIGISIAAPCLAFLFVLLRLYTRYFVTRNLGWDDAFIIIPMVLSTAQAYTTVMGIKINYLGYHAKDIPLDKLNFVLGAKYDYATQLLYNPILALVKNGMLLFFLRVGGSIDNLRWFIIALIVFNTSLMIAIFVTDMLQCIPIRKTFYPTIPGSCIEPSVFFIATAALTILTDILVMIIPTWITWNLQLKLRKKLAIIFLLSMGLLVTGISVYRMYYLIIAYYGPPNSDLNYGVGGTSSSIEVNLAIAAACGPFLKPIILTYFPTFFGRNTTRRYDEYNGRSTDVMGYYGKPRTSTYSATASASAKRKSKRASMLRGVKELDAGLELQRPRAKSQRIRRATNAQSLTLVGNEEDNSSQRRIITVDAMIFSSGELGQNKRGSKQSRHTLDGIMTERSVDITYSPKDSDEEFKEGGFWAPGLAV